MWANMKRKPRYMVQVRVESNNRRILTDNPVYVINNENFWKDI